MDLEGSNVEPTAFFSLVWNFENSYNNRIKKHTEQATRDLYEKNHQN